MSVALYLDLTMALGCHESHHWQWPSRTLPPPADTFPVRLTGTGRHALEGLELGPRPPSLVLLGLWAPFLHDALPPSVFSQVSLAPGILQEDLFIPALLFAPSTASLEGGRQQRFCQLWFSCFPQ